jgi:hypothetical protein
MCGSALNLPYNRHTVNWQRIASVIPRAR